MNEVNDPELSKNENTFNNESEENLSNNNIPHINTEENYDTKRQRSSNKMVNIDYENYIRNNFRNSTTLESEQLKDLRELESESKIQNFINLNSNINFNFSDNMNYNNETEEFTEGNSIQNANLKNSVNNFNDLDTKSKEKKQNLLLATPKDAKINPNSNSYSFTRNQTPNFFYSKGKIPMNKCINKDLSMQKLNSQESFGADICENKSNIKINQSIKAFESNFQNNKQTLYNNNSNSISNNKPKSGAFSKAFVNDLPFNYNSNSNFNFSNPNIIKEPESMSLISNINDNESNINKILETKIFTLKFDDNRLITLKPEEYVDTFENNLDFTGITFNSTKNKNNKHNIENNFAPNNDFNYNYYGHDYQNHNINDNFNYNKNNKNKNNEFSDNNKSKETLNKRRTPNLNDDVYNMPLQQKKNKNYAIGASKINESYLKDALVERNNKINNSAKKKNHIAERFLDLDRKPLAVFFSSKNDIRPQLNERRFNESIERGNLNNFANNFTHTNISFNQNYVFEKNDNNYETFNSDGDLVNINNTYCSINTDKKRKSFRQSYKSKKISLETLNRNNNTNSQRREYGKHNRNDSYKNVKTTLLTYFIIFYQMKLFFACFFLKYFLKVKK